jgi:hypothetical protein
MAYPINVAVVRTDRRTLTTALQGLLGDVSGYVVEIADVPQPPTGARVPTTPYASIYPLNIGRFWGATYGVQKNGAFAYQVTSVGARGDQAEWMADVVRSIILGQDADGAFVYPILVPGMKVTLRESPEGAGFMDRSDLLYYIPERFIIHAESLT